MVEVFKREKEPTGSLLRRFTKKVQQSRILIRMRRNKFYQKPQSRSERRASAIKRLKVKKEKAFLEKLGVLNEELPRKRRRY